jgi:hypothetical protein
VCASRSVRRSHNSFGSAAFATCASLLFEPVDSASSYVPDPFAVAITDQSKVVRSHMVVLLNR